MELENASHWQLPPPAVDEEEEEETAVGRGERVVERGTRELVELAGRLAAPMLVEVDDGRRATAVELEEDDEVEVAALLFSSLTLVMVFGALCGCSVECLHRFVCGLC